MCFFKIHHLHTKMGVYRYKWWFLCRTATSTNGYSEYSLIKNTRVLILSYSSSSGRFRMVLVATKQKDIDLNKHIKFFVPLCSMHCLICFLPHCCHGLFQLSVPQRLHCCSWNILAHYCTWNNGWKQNTRNEPQYINQCRQTHKKIQRDRRIYERLE